VKTVEDILHDHFPEEDVLYLKEVAIALDVHHADEMVAAHERGVRKERRRILALLEAGISKAREQRRTFKFSTQGWLVNATRQVSLGTLRGAILQVPEEEV